VNIRPFRKHDFDALWRIDQACFDPELAYSRIELAVYMRRPASFTLVAEAAEPQAPSVSPPILGFVVAESRRRIGHIITIDVIAESRRSGVGSCLLDAAEERLQHSGVTEVALETPVNNVAAIRFYKTKGYFVEKTVPGYYSNRLDAFLMRKDLVPLEGND
jgi:ribosomal protein S18 acetylase RimI-like enzyme